MITDQEKNLKLMDIAGECPHLFDDKDYTSIEEFWQSKCPQCGLSRNDGAYHPSGADITPRVDSTDLLIDFAHKYLLADVRIDMGMRGTVSVYLTLLSAPLAEIHVPIIDHEPRGHARRHALTMAIIHGGKK